MYLSPWRCTTLPQSWPWSRSRGPWRSSGWASWWMSRSPPPPSYWSDSPPDRTPSRKYHSLEKITSFDSAGSINFFWLRSSVTKYLTFNFVMLTPNKCTDWVGRWTHTLCRFNILIFCRENKKFRVFVLVPLLPAFEGQVEDATTGNALKVILHYNYASMCRGTNSLLSRLIENGVNPMNYISFTSLRYYYPSVTFRIQKKSINLNQLKEGSISGTSYH